MAVHLARSKILKKAAILVFLSILFGLSTGAMPAGAKTDDGSSAADQTQQTGSETLGSKSLGDFTATVLALTDKVKEKAHLTLAKNESKTEESEVKSKSKQST